jgi:hypothetical protein
VLIVVLLSLPPDNRTVPAVAAANSVGGGFFCLRGYDIKGDPAGTGDMENPVQTANTELAGALGGSNDCWFGQCMTRAWARATNECPAQWSQQQMCICYSWCPVYTHVQLADHSLAHSP